MRPNESWREDLRIHALPPINAVKRMKNCVKNILCCV